MLPSINTQQRRILAHNRILIRICSNLNLSCLVILDQPCPATTLDTGESGVEFGLERGEIAVRGFDCGLYLPSAFIPNDHPSLL